MLDKSSNMTNKTFFGLEYLSFMQKTVKLQQNVYKNEKVRYFFSVTRRMFAKMENDLLEPVLKSILKKCYKSLFKRNATNYLSQKIIFQ